MDRAYIIHGWGGSQRSNWFPWLEERSEAEGIRTRTLAMPDPDHPRLSDWLAGLRAAIGLPDDETFLIGHSLGAMAILRYLESLEEGERVGGAILVAGFPESIGIREIDNFFDPPLDYEKVRLSAGRLAAINSDNDPYVPLRQGEILRDKLGAEFSVLAGAYHINQESGFFELPEALEILKRWKRGKK